MEPEKASTSSRMKTKKTKMLMSFKIRFEHVPANKISPKFKRVHESFLSPELFSAKVKRFFCVFSVFIQPEKASTRMKIKKTKMFMSFKNTVSNKNRHTQKFFLNLKI